LKLPDKSAAAGAFGYANCRSEAVGIGISPLSFGESEKTGKRVYCIKTSIKNTINIKRENPKI